VANIASGLLQLAAPDASSADKSDAKQRLSKALKLAHGRLQNHQVVSQVLLFMAPLQVRAVITCSALADSTQNTYPAGKAAHACTAGWHAVGRHHFFALLL
jgi:hypothetical protein